MIYSEALERRANPPVFSGSLSSWPAIPPQRSLGGELIRHLNRNVGEMQLAMPAN